MGLVILVILLGLPVAEIVAFVVIGGEIGVLATLAWVFLAAVAGIVIMRLQGLATALQVRAAMAHGELPAHALLVGACVTVAGLLLLFPGFVSDALAALLLVPPLRDLMFRLLARRFAGHVDVTLHGAAGPASGGGPGRRRGAPGRRGVIIEGEFEEVQPREHVGDTAEDTGDDDGERLPPPEGGPR